MHISCTIDTVVPTKWCFLLNETDLELISPHGFLAPFVMHFFSRTILISVWITCMYDMYVYGVLLMHCGIFLQRTHKGHPMAHLKEWVVECLLWVHNVIKVSMSCYPTTMYLEAVINTIIVLWYYHDHCTCAYLCSWLCNLNECWYCVCMTINIFWLDLTWLGAPIAIQIKSSQLKFIDIRIKRITFHKQ